MFSQENTNVAGELNILNKLVTEKMINYLEGATYSGSIIFPIRLVWYST